MTSNGFASQAQLMPASGKGNSLELALEVSAAAEACGDERPGAAKEAGQHHFIQA